MRISDTELVWRRRIEQASVAALAVAMAASLLLPQAPAGAQAVPAPPTYLRTIGFPGGAEMYPTGVDIGTSGNVYVADDGNSRVLKYNASGQLVDQWGSHGRGGNGLFDHARGVTVDSSENVYVSDQGNGRIQKFDSNGNFLLKWGGLNQPRELTADVNNNIWVVHGTKVQKFSSTGTPLMQFGTFGSGPGQFNQPRGIAVDDAGFIYVTDAKNNRVQKFDPLGNYILEFGTGGSSPGQFNYPGYVAVNPAGTVVYVVDRGGHRVQRFDSNGVFLGHWGGKGTAPGQFQGPRGVAVDSSGDVFVTDMWNYRVQKFDASGTFIRVWGGGKPPDGGFNYPRGCAISPNGEIHTVEWWNQRVQKFSPLDGGEIPYESIVQGDGPAGYWRLGETSGTTAVDSTGNAHHGTFQGAVSLGQPALVPGAADPAVGLNGSSTYVSIPDGQKINQTRAVSKSIELWFQADSVSGPHVLYEQGGSQRGLAMYLHQGRLYFGVWGLESVPWESFLSTPVGTGSVYHAVLVFEENNVMSAYVNGALVGEDTSSVLELRAHSDDVGIGAVRQTTRLHTGASSAPAYFDGTIDDVAHYHGVALTGAQVQRHYEGDALGGAEFITKWGRRGATNEELNFPSGIAVDGTGNVYVADSENHRIMKYGPDGRFLMRFGKQGSANGQFQFPRGVVVDAAGNIYVVEGQSSNSTVVVNHRVQKFSPSGAFITKWGLRGSGIGEFDSPQGIALDASGDVYVADTTNRRVQVFDANGNFERVIGGSGTGDGQFLEPRAVAVDSQGNVYVTDAKRNDVQKFNPDGSFASKWGSLGTGDNGFNNPWGICLDDSDRIYVMDTWNGRMQVYSP